MTRKLSLKSFIFKLNLKIKSGDLTKAKALAILRAKRASVMRKKSKASKDEVMLLKELRKLKKKRR